MVNSVKGRRTALVVVGMHRSGTSVLTHALALAGFLLPKRLMPAGADNSEGFWEPSYIVELNERILTTLGQDWTSTQVISQNHFKSGLFSKLKSEAKALLLYEYGSKDDFVLKDPRMGRLLPFWEPVFRSIRADVKLVCIVRHPLEVARSLERRDGLGLMRCFKMWISHNIAVLDASRRLPCSFVRMEDFMNGPSNSVLRIFEQLNLLKSITDGVRSDIEGLIKPDLRHYSSTRAVLSDVITILSICEKILIIQADHERDTAGMSESLVHIQDALDTVEPTVSGFDSDSSSDRLMQADARRLFKIGIANLLELERKLNESIKIVLTLQGNKNDVSETGTSLGYGNAHYEGRIDKVFGSILCGWCWMKGFDHRVKLCIELDGRLVAEVVASLYRGDLYSHGIGDGWHGFGIDLLTVNLKLEGSMVVCVKTHDGFELPGSGSVMSDLLCD